MGAVVVRPGMDVVPLRSQALRTRPSRRCHPEKVGPGSRTCRSRATPPAGVVRRGTGQIWAQRTFLPATIRPFWLVRSIVSFTFPSARRERVNAGGAQVGRGHLDAVEIGHGSCRRTRRRARGSRSPGRPRRTSFARRTTRTRDRLAVRVHPPCACRRAPSPRRCPQPDHGLVARPNRRSSPRARASRGRRPDLPFQYFHVSGFHEQLGGVDRRDLRVILEVVDERDPEPVRRM